MNTSEFIRALITSRMRSFSTLATALCLALVLPTSSKAYQLKQGSTGAFMQNVNDPTNGLRYLLIDDDLSLVRVTLNSDKSLSGTVTAVDTADSGFSGTKQSFPINMAGTNVSSLSTSNGTFAAEAAGRMLNAATDSIVTLTVSPYSSTVGGWSWNVTDPATNYNESGELQASFVPANTVPSQVVMGNFAGNGFSQALLFFASENTSTKSGEWGCRFFPVTRITHNPTLCSARRYCRTLPLGFFQWMAVL